MKLPNKIIRYRESVISKFPSILNNLSRGESSVLDLYMAVKSQMDDIADFADALSSLYALGKINYNPTTRRLSYVATNM